MEYTGLFFELLFLMLGVYLYFFSIGKIRSKDPEKQKKAEAFRRENAGWLKILALALTAIMLVNFVLHLKALWGTD
ncbi:MAG: hypothetical protein D6714_11675 [Bacteroidetes bacterium]|nr:MAG: hypothetical protein D6714_11675 [Bacteroidota bacterium]